MSLISCIQKNFSYAIITRCSEMNCKLKLNNLNKYVVLKGEKICKNGKICDCIIFKENERIIVGIIELKSRNVHANEIVKKLTNGTKIAWDIIEKCCKVNKIDFYHIVLHKGIHSSEFEIITAQRIEVRGKKYPIILKKCGESFSKIISNLK